MCCSKAIHFNLICRTESFKLTCYKEVTFFFCFLLLPIIILPPANGIKLKNVTELKVLHLQLNNELQGSTYLKGNLSQTQITLWRKEFLFFPANLSSSVSSIIQQGLLTYVQKTKNFYPQKMLSYLYKKLCTRQEM